MIRDGFERQGEESDESFKYRYNRNSEVLEICKTDNVSKLIRKQRNYAAHWYELIIPPSD